LVRGSNPCGGTNQLASVLTFTTPSEFSSSLLQADDGGYAAPMTLLAAFQNCETPILLGDFLLTSPGQIGSRKKVHLISPNLVVGWTGNRLSARLVLRDLHAEFAGQNVTRIALENFLTRYPTADLSSLEVRLVGWVVDGEAKCFLWNSLYPTELFYEGSHFDGSGAAAFEMLLNQRSIIVDATAATRTEQAIKFALIKSGKLIAKEIMIDIDAVAGFGFGFEILYFDGKQFRFVDNVLYSAFDVFLNVKTSEISTVFLGGIVKYRSFENYSVIQMSFPVENLTKLFAMTAVFDDMPDLKDRIPEIDTSKNEKFSLVSDYYCIYYRLFASDGLTTNGVMIYCPSDPGNHVEVVRYADGTERFGPDFGFVREVYSRLKSYGEIQHSTRRV
jgi:hypothetical protein